MKHAHLKVVGHNIADSLASGIGLMIGVYVMDVFAEASAGEPGYLEVDFLEGTTRGTSASPSLHRAVQLYCRQALPDLCRKHSVDLAQVKAIRARYGVDAVYGRHFSVTVEDSRGKRSTDHYLGTPGRRIRQRE